MTSLNRFFLNFLIIGLLLTCNLIFAKGAPITHQTAKDFKNLIIQGERPEIVACMAATLNEIKRNKTFDAFHWLDATSKTALMHENEINGKLTRNITLQAQAVLSGKSFFDLITPLQIECEQVDEGYPFLKITIVH